MVQQQAANSIRSQGDGFADDDPLAELARIVGFDQPLKREPVMSLPPVPDMASAEFNLEDELMREFEGYEQTSSALSEMRAPEPVVPHAPSPVSVREEPSFAPISPAFGVDVPSYEPPVPVSAIEQFEEPAAIAHEPPAPDVAISYDLADELELAVADADIRPAPAVQAEPPRLRLPLANFSAQVQPVRRAELELSQPQEVFAPDVMAPVAAPPFGEEPVAVSPVAPRSQPASQSSSAEEPVFEWETGAFSFAPAENTAPHSVLPNFAGSATAADRAVSFAAPKADAGPEVAARTEPDFSFDFSADLSLDEGLDVAPEPIKAVPEKSVPVSLADDDFDPFGDQDFELKLDELDLALDLSEIEPVSPASSVTTAAKPLSSEPVSPTYSTAAVSAAVAPAIPAAWAAAPARSEPVAVPRRVEPEMRVSPDATAYRPSVVPTPTVTHSVQPQAPQPAIQQAYVPPSYSVDDSFGFDPSEISEQDEQLESVGALDVPEVPVTETRAAAPAQSEYDIDIDAELATLFEEPVAPQPPVKTLGASRVVADAAPARSAAAPLDDFDAFEKALEEDLRSSLSTARAIDPESRGHITIAGEAQGFRFRRMKPYLMTGTAVLLLLAGAGGLYAWLGNGTVGSLSGGEPQIIAADKTPVKIVPENPGGKSVPNQDKAVYDRVAGNGVEDPKQTSLISSEEEPVDVVQRTLIPENMPLEGENEAAATPVGETEDPRLLPDGQPQGTAAAAEDPATITPRKVRTMIVRPDGTLVAQEVPAEAAPATANTSPSAAPTSSPAVLAAPSVPAAKTDDAVKTVETRVVNPSAPTETAAASPATTAAAPATTATAPVTPPTAAPAATAPQTVAEIAAASTAETDTAPAVKAPIPTMRPADQPVNVVGTVTDQGNLRPSQPAATQAPAPTETAAATPAAAPAAAPAGSYGIQIASLPSEAEAQRSYRSLSSKFGLLSGKPYEIRQADIPGKGTYYRVRIVAGSKDAAVALCEQYRSAGGTCLVSK